METSDLKSVYDRLLEILNDFDESYYDYSKGKNKKIRATASSKLKMLMRTAENLILMYPELIKLITAAPDAYSRSIVWNEFFLIKYFSGDMSEFLNKFNLHFFKHN